MGPLYYFSNICVHVHSGHPPPLSAGGVEPPTKFSKRGGGGLTGPQLLEGVARKEGVTFFRGVAIFT